MFEGFSEKTVDFMWGIRLNNNREWFGEHKDEFRACFERPMNELANEVYADFSREYPELGLLLHVSRIYLDARRPRPFGPYRDHLWFSIRRPADYWPEKPSFWFELGPDGWSYGLGYYMARPETMAKFRARIDNDPTAMLKLASLLEGQTEFSLEGESYKRPKGSPGNGLDGWYNMKNFSLIHSEPLSGAVKSKELKDRLLDGFSFLMPFHDYLSTLDDDPEPVKK